MINNYFKNSLIYILKKKLFEIVFYSYAFKYLPIFTILLTKIYWLYWFYVLIYCNRWHLLKSVTEYNSISSSFSVYDQ